MPYHLYWSVLIYLVTTASISAVGPSCLLQLVLTDCNSLFPTYLHHSVTSDWYSPDNPTDCSSLIPSVLNSLLATTLWYSYDIIPVSGLKVQQAVTGLWRFCVCRSKCYRREFLLLTSIVLQHERPLRCKKKMLCVKAMLHEAIFSCNLQLLWKRYCMFL